MIKIDFREKDLFSECEGLKNKYPKINFEYANLFLGDIQIEKILIERKTLNDLAASIKDGRYTEQSFRLKESMKEGYKVYYFIEGNLSTYKSSSISKETLISCIFSFTNKGFYVINTMNVKESALFILQFTDKIERDKLKNKKSKNDNLINQVNNEDNSVKNIQMAEESTEEVKELTYEECSIIKQKNKNINKNNICIFMLSQIPGISTTIAFVLMDKYKHLNCLIDDLNKNSECLNNFTYEKEGKKRKLGKNIIQNLKEYLIYINPNVITPGLPCV
jgi:ERCC4-type nuclease